MLLNRRLFICVFSVVASLLVLSCGKGNNKVVDMLNEKSYSFHYRNIDSTTHYALEALKYCGNYSSGHAEALNNLAFVDIVRMRYNHADKLLDSIYNITDNQIELLVADVQKMRLCQRRSRNKSFYEYLESAESRLNRINDGKHELDTHSVKRMAYVESEYRLVASTYYYYMGLPKLSRAMIDSINVYGPIERDTAQILNYWYNIGSGGVLHGKPAMEIAQEEFGYLTACYVTAVEKNYPFFEAQALQAMSEHLQQKSQRDSIIKYNYASVVAVNIDMMPDSLLAGNLAQRAQRIFSQYGDVYQTAGGWRTLAECFWQIKDYRSALICLHNALSNKVFVSQAPDLVASIREQLCLVYSAVDDKKNSDRNRNIYLDLQEQTRQDRQLEARASQLDNSSRQLNVIIVVVIIMIIGVVTMLVVFAKMRRRSDKNFSVKELLRPLDQWQKRSEAVSRQVVDNLEDIEEQTAAARLSLAQNRRRNLEQRAKVQLVNSVLPLIDRMSNEVRRLEKDEDNGGLSKQRYEYIGELTDSIVRHNEVLTQWIQMRQGEVRLHIESFNLQSLFDIVSHGRMGFKLKGITLEVEPTQAVVKADRVLTLFMINTIADNARKFTPEGGKVKVFAVDEPDFVEISIEDNGKGMDEETMSNIFNRTYTGGHGFGLKNCNGIIEKYKKISRLFNVCQIGARSIVGKGTRIFFRLPKGRLRMIVALLAASLSMLMPHNLKAATPGSHIAQAFADSAYNCNIRGDYQRTIAFADSCRKYVTRKDTMVLLDISNETAVAALALHRWQLYHESNDVYTRLFRQASADSSLPGYVHAMQRNNTNKKIAVGLLVIMLVFVFPAYYFLYYRHKMNYRFCVELIQQMNDVLLSDATDAEKLASIRKLDDFSKFNLTDLQRQSIADIVRRIEKALEDSIANAEKQSLKAELSGDELHRIRLDSDRLYIANSVLDNCLSTLKHETMYYPPRIRQLIDSGENNLPAIREVVDYYHDLYAILAEQSTRQLRPPLIDKSTVEWLLELLKKCNGGEVLKVSQVVDAIPVQYVKLRVVMDGMSVTDEQAAALFTPATVNLDFMLCRQIIRDMGDVTNLRACGIAARNEDGTTIVEILMPKRYYKKI